MTAISSESLISFLCFLSLTTLISSRGIETVTSVSPSSGQTTVADTDSPTEIPSNSPSIYPTLSASDRPTKYPTKLPTKNPSTNPSVSSINPIKYQRDGVVETTQTTQSSTTDANRSSNQLIVWIFAGVLISTSGTVVICGVAASKIIIKDRAKTDDDIQNSNEMDISSQKSEDTNEAETSVECDCEGNSNQKSKREKSNVHKRESSTSSDGMYEVPNIMMTNTGGTPDCKDDSIKEATKH